MTTPPSPYGPGTQPHNGFSGYGAPSGQPASPYGSQPQQGFGAHGGAYGGHQQFGGQQQFSGQQQFGGYGTNSFGPGGPPPQSPGSGKNNSAGNGPLVWSEGIAD